MTPEIAEAEKPPILSVSSRGIRIQKREGSCVLTEREAAALMAELYDYFEKRVLRKRKGSGR